MEGILGFERVGSALKIDPVLPPHWDGYELSYRWQTSTYRIAVRNPGHAARGVRQVTLDGQPVTGGLIPLVDDGKEHPVVVEMGG
jgi:cellobiose phosphorylase